jgi:hypothetical protein
LPRPCPSPIRSRLRLTVAMVQYGI